MIDGAQTSTRNSLLSQKIVHPLGGRRLEVFIDQLYKMADTYHYYLNGDEQTFGGYYSID